MMKHWNRILLAAVFGGVLTAAVCGAETDVRRQTYPLDPVKVKQNRSQVAEARKNAPGAWQKIPYAYFTVVPLGAEPYLPDEIPAAAKPFAPLEIIAAQGEFEPASFLIYPLEKAGKMEILPGVLKNKSGSTVPVKNIDVKMVKTWYKSGSAWYGMFVDPLRRRLIPELLLNDETLIFADPEKQENYMRLTAPDGNQRYDWISAGVQIKNWRNNEPNYKLIQDADTFQGVVLNPDELKQIMVTVKVPAEAAPGLYTGALKLRADGKAAGEIPVRLRVLPFALPAPKTKYNPEKDFIVSFYGAGQAGGLNMKRAQNCADHNVKNLLGFPSTHPFQIEKAEQHAQMAKQTGMGTDTLLATGVSCGLAVNENPTPYQQALLKTLEGRLTRLAALTKRLYGHTNFYSYGIDEGDAWAVRAQQPAWELVRKAGGKVMVTTYPRNELMFNLDMVNLPFAPHPEFAADAVRKIHQANPDAITAWYSNPHTGPENPDFTRRFYGLVPYGNGFDANMQYAMLNHNVKMWNEFGDTYESDRRSHSILYPTKDDYVDTLAWEGLREGIDDIRYMTLLRQVAEQAVSHKDPAVQQMGRKARSMIAYTDCTRKDAENIRMEAIRWILCIRNAMAAK